MVATETQAFVIILIVHYIGDFIAQSDWQAKNKSTSYIALIRHTLMYSAIWFLGASWLFDGDVFKCLVFAAITFVAHTITDALTSRATKHFFDKKDHHNGFVVIGFDQILHYLQLYFTFLWMLKMQL